MAELDKAARVKREVNRLKKIFKDIPENKRRVCEGLIVQAARLRISLDDLFADIVENGDVELFSQSEKTEPYERERPAARLFNARDKNYQSVIKQLCDLVPDGEAEKSELMSFLNRK